MQFAADGVMMMQFALWGDDDDLIIQGSLHRDSLMMTCRMISAAVYRTHTH